MPRADGRQPDELRAVTITRHFLKYSEGSVLITLGDTKVVCSASIDERVPHWMRGGGRGWISAADGTVPPAACMRQTCAAGRAANAAEDRRARMVSAAGIRRGDERWDRGRGDRARPELSGGFARAGGHERGDDGDRAARRSGGRPGRCPRHW